MNYRVRRQEEDLGVFTLAELHHRRESGEFTGGENVQVSGTDAWRSLDQVLKQGDPVATPPPPSPASNESPRNGLRWLIIVGGIMVAVGITVYFRQPPAQALPPPPPKGFEIASKPVLVAKTPTVTDTQARTHRFMMRQWLEGYEKRGIRNPASDAKVDQFIRTYVEKYNEGPQAPSSIELAAESIRLENDPNCTDPLVLTLAGDYTLNWYSRVHLFERAIAAFPASSHRAFPALFANVSLMSESKYKYDQEGELNSAALDLLPKCFADGSLTPDDQQEIAEIFVDGWGSGFFELNGTAICEVVHQAGPAYEWLGLVLDGERCINEAWKARGGGYSYTVTSEGRMGFNEYLAEARTHLTQAWNLQPLFPLAPDLMIYVSLGDKGLEEMRAWFDRTVAAQFDYPGAWSNMRWGLRPRWYGSEGAMIAFGEMALHTGRYDTDVPRKFFDSVRDLESEEGLQSGQHIYGHPHIWPELQKMYEGYIAEPSAAPHLESWRSSYAAVAYFAGKYDVARSQLEALDWKLSAASMLSWGVDLSSMPLEVAARTGPLGVRVSAAETAREAGKLDGALKLYSDLASEPVADERTKEFIQFRKARLTDETRFNEGKWVSLMPASDHDPNWTYNFGEAHRTADGALEVEFGPKGHMMFSKMPVGTNFEVRGRFDNVRSSNTNWQAGIVMGLPDINAYNWIGFRLKRHDVEGDVVCIGMGWTLREMVQRVPLNDTTNSFDFVYKDGKMSATVNGDEIFHEAAPPADINVPDSSYLVGLGAFSDSEDAVIRYRDVEVRKSDVALPVAVAPSAPSPTPTADPAHPPTVPERIAADKEELRLAIERVKQIVNAPARSVPITPEMNVTSFGDAWFHPGAIRPDFNTVDVRTTQDLSNYSKFAYVSSNMTPTIAFPGGGLEFNPMTKFFYTDRTVPKRKLTEAEMVEINRLYRVIGRCEAELKTLSAP